MIVKRIVTNFAATDVSKARRFYADILGPEVVMDHGWIVTFCLARADGTSGKRRNRRRFGDASAGHLGRGG
jgi:catechol 2,3-dioxygenase-like lactoylglutathione lyase family enzyme